MTDAHKQLIILVSILFLALAFTWGLVIFSTSEETGSEITLDEAEEEVVLSSPMLLRRLYEGGQHFVSGIIPERDSCIPVLAQAVVDGSKNPENVSLNIVTQGENSCSETDSIQNLFLISFRASANASFSATFNGNSAQYAIEDVTDRSELVKIEN